MNRGNLTDESLQSSKWEIYQDAFAHQPPQRRSKAWDRAPVLAHARRLQGQRIWKKAGLRSNQNKKNRDVSQVELAKEGSGARKRQKLTGEKNKIGDAQWQNVRSHDSNVFAELLPKKKDGYSLASADVDAILIPRKRTSANHLITPRKPAHTSQLSETDTKIAFSGMLSLKIEDQKGAEDEGVRQVVGSSEMQAVKHVCRRKSMRRSSRRLANGDSWKSSPVARIDNMGDHFEYSMSRSVPEVRIWTQSVSIAELAESKTQPAMAEQLANAPKILEHTHFAAIPSRETVESVFTVGNVESNAGATPAQQFMSENFEDCVRKPTGHQKFMQAEISSELVHQPHNQADEPFPTDDQGCRENSIFNIEAKVEPHAGKVSSNDFTKIDIKKRDSVICDIHVESHKGPPEIAIASPLTFIRLSEKTDSLASCSTRLTLQNGDARRGLRIVRKISDSMDRDYGESKDLTDTSKADLNEKTPQPSPASFVVQENYPILEFELTEIKNATARSENTDREFHPACIEIESNTKDNVQDMEITKTVIHDQRDTHEQERDVTETNFSKIPPLAISDAKKVLSNESNIDKKEIKCAHAANVYLNQDKAAAEKLVDDTRCHNGSFMDSVIQGEMKVLAGGTVTQYNSTSKISEEVTISKAADMEVIACLTQENLLNKPNPMRISGDNAHDESFEVTKASFAPVMAAESVLDELGEDLHGTSTTDPDSTQLVGIISEHAPTITYVPDDDTDMLRNFLTRVKADKVAKASTATPMRKWSLPHSPIQVPLGSMTESVSPSPKSIVEDDNTAAVKAPAKRKRAPPVAVDKEGMAEPKSIRRSGRTRPPMKAVVPAPSFIPVRRLGPDVDSTMTLRRSEEKELAALTRVNTRKNKGSAIGPAELLSKKLDEKEDPAARQCILKGGFVVKIQQQKEKSKKHKTVVWAEDLAQYQSSHRNSPSEPDAPRDVENMASADKQEMAKVKPKAKVKAKAEAKKTSVKLGLPSQLRLSLNTTNTGTQALQRKKRERA